MLRQAFNVIVALSITIGVYLFTPFAASALELQCYQRDVLFGRLMSKTGQRLAFTGIGSGGALLEVLVAPDGTWTLFFSFTNGLTCPVGDGENWRAAPVVLPGQGS